MNMSHEELKLGETYYMFYSDYWRLDDGRLETFEIQINKVVLVAKVEKKTGYEYMVSTSYNGREARDVTCTHLYKTKEDALLASIKSLENKKL